jgi:hypothetical protein
MTGVKNGSCSHMARDLPNRIYKLSVQMEVFMANESELFYLVLLTLLTLVVHIILSTKNSRNHRRHSHS